MLRVYAKALLEVLSGLGEVHLFKIDHAELAVRLEVIWVFFDHKLVILYRCVNVRCKRMDRLAEAVVSCDRVRIDFQRMLEVLGGLRCLILLS